MHFFTRFSGILLAGLIGLGRLYAAGSDVLILSDDEKLIGRFVRSNGGSVVFKSDILGELTIDWSKIKELHAAGPYAVVGKDLPLARHPDRSQIPTGPLEMTGQTITVTQAGTAKKIPVAEAAHVVDEAALDKALHTPGLKEDWAGAVTAGATVVEATQNSRNFTGALNLVRAVPSETWLAPRNRTIIGFSVTDGKLTQPNTPSLKTNIVHAAVEQDEYLHDSVYAFGQAIFDHNYSQGLDLAQIYGGGIGWTAINKANQTLDLSGSVNYVKQQFSAGGNSHNLAGSTFGEKFKRILPHGIVFQEGISVTPTWSERKNWMAAGTASFTVPVYKRLGFSINVLDSFLNDPPPGFKKNSFQVSTGLTYSLR